MTYKITTSGQVSIPASVRRRWRTSEVQVEDHGDHVIVRPVTNDPVAAVRGIFKDRITTTTDELRRQAREEDRRADERKGSKVSPVIVLDAYAIVALMRDEPASELVAGLITQGNCALSAINLAEAADVLERSQGLQTSVTRAAITTLLSAPLAILDVDERRAWRAAEVRAGHYHRNAEISIADCILLASARPGEDSIATPDPPVIRIASELGIDVIPLPDSTGRRPA